MRTILVILLALNSLLTSGQKKTIVHIYPYHQSDSNGVRKMIFQHYNKAGKIIYFTTFKIRLDDPFFDRKIMAELAKYKN